MICGIITECNPIVKLYIMDESENHEFCYVTSLVPFTKGIKYFF